MLRADHTPITPTRRRALHFSAMAAIAGLTAPKLAPTKASAQTLPPADAELLRLCSRFHRLHAATFNVPEEDEDGLTAALGRRWAVSDEISEVCARTGAGMMAKANVGLVILEESQNLESMDADVSFAYDVLRDLIRRAA